jgi:hypothetical protein
MVEELMFIVTRGAFSNIDTPLQDEEMAVMAELVRAGENGRDYGQCSDVATGLSLSFLYTRGCVEHIPHPEKHHILRVTPHGMRRYAEQAKGKR